MGPHTRPDAVGPTCKCRALQPEKRSSRICRRRDPAVVAKQAIQEATRTKSDVVLVDTAERMQDNDLKLNVKSIVNFFEKKEVHC